MSVDITVDLPKVVSWKTVQSDTTGGAVYNGTISPIRNDVVDVVELESSNTNISGSTADLPVNVSSSRQEVPIGRLYPQFLDVDTEHGRLRVLIRDALGDSRHAVDSYQTGDIAAVDSYLANIAAVMQEAYDQTEFNDNLGAVISFVRRAAITASAEEVSLSSLHALVNALSNISQNPFMDLSAAADLVDGLSDEGWRGEHQAVSAILELFVGESDVVDTHDDTGLQPELFEG
jgi:hypothetical protein